MNKIFISTAFLLSLAFISCSKDDDDVAPATELAVTNHNLSGTWTASEWRGEPLPEGASVTLTLVRRDQTFTLVQNLGSMYPQTFSGTYSLRQDDDTELWILSGFYDYDGGSWAHDYYVTSLTATRMVLKATDDADDVTIYTKDINE